MPFEINFYSYLGILAIFYWSSISCSSLISWMPHVFIICLHTYIWFHNYWTNIWLYIFIFFEKQSGSCRICFWLRKLVSAAETGVSCGNRCQLRKLTQLLFGWMEKNGWQMTRWKWSWKRILLVKWNEKWSEMEWSGVKWSGMKWNGMEWVVTKLVKWKRDFFWKI